ncbi:MAG TPA: type II secretion system F family protein [Candidatus Dormibacteraeota bacterium]|jgi:tight adherence protein C|nr:type II secretion system F family protein [Candidatus Dormibacteraeota bacterium]
MSSSILSIALALAVAFGVFLVFQGMSRPQTDLLETRLAQFGDHELTLAEMEMALPFGERFLRPILDRMGGYITSRTPANRTQQLQDKINLAGRPLNLTPGSLLTLQLISLLVLTAAGFGIANLMALQGSMVILGPAGGGVLGYLVPSIWLDRRVKARQKEIRVALPNALDLLTISVEAGLGFDAAVSRVTEKYHNALALEFTQVLNEVRLGRPRMEALEDMARRNKVDELNNFIQAVVQSDQLGVGIAQVLRIQSEEMRRRRRQRAEEMGAKAPLKMLFPMVGCIFPALFIVLLGPAVIQVYNQFIGH